MKVLELRTLSNFAIVRGVKPATASQSQVVRDAQLIKVVEQLIHHFSVEKLSCECQVSDFQCRCTIGSSPRPHAGKPSLDLPKRRILEGETVDADQVPEVCQHFWIELSIRGKTHHFPFFAFFTTEAAKRGTNCIENSQAP